MCHDSATYHELLKHCLTRSDASAGSWRPESAPRGRWDDDARPEQEIESGGRAGRQNTKHPRHKHTKSQSRDPALKMQACPLPSYSESSCNRKGIMKKHPTPIHQMTLMQPSRCIRTRTWQKTGGGAAPELHPRHWIPGSWIQDPRPWIEDPGS